MWREGPHLGRWNPKADQLGLYSFKLILDASGAQVIQRDVVHSVGPCRNMNKLSIFVLSLRTHKEQRLAFEHLSSFYPLHHPSGYTCWLHVITSRAKQI